MCEWHCGEFIRFDAVASVFTYFLMVCITVYYTSVGEFWPTDHPFLSGFTTVMCGCQVAQLSLSPLKCYNVRKQIRGL